jgi:hypothetical protein
MELWEAGKELQGKMAPAMSDVEAVWIECCQADWPNHLPHCPLHCQDCNKASKTIRFNSRNATRQLSCELLNAQMTWVRAAILNRLVDTYWCYGGSTFLQNNGIYLPIYTTPHPRRQCPSRHCRQNPKSSMYELIKIWLFMMKLCLFQKIITFFRSCPLSIHVIIFMTPLPFVTCFLWSNIFTRTSLHFIRHRTQRFMHWNKKFSPQYTTSGMWWQLLWPIILTFCPLINPKDGAIWFVQDIATYLSDDTASHPKKLQHW